MHFAALVACALVAQSADVSIIVTAIDGRTNEPISGVAIKVFSASNSSISEEKQTDASGTAKIDVSKGHTRIKIRATLQGFENAVKQVASIKAGGEYTIALVPTRSFTADRWPGGGSALSGLPAEQTLSVNGVVYWRRCIRETPYGDGFLLREFTEWQPLSVWVTPYSLMRPSSCGCFP